MIVVFAIVLGLGSRLVAAKEVTIQNVKPRVDVNGEIMDIHDGNTFYHPQSSQYYYFGASYGNCTEPAGPTGCAGAGGGKCGFRYDHNVSLYTTTDFSAFVPHGPVLQVASLGLPDTQAVMFCPKVLYNEATGKWVLWFNWISGSDFSKSYYAVTTADSPTGPYTLVSANVSLAHPDMGDFNLFLDEDQTAYIIYTSDLNGPQPNHKMSIERLDATYTASTKESSGFFGHSFVEAPSLFRDKTSGFYFAVFGECCCYCNDASPVHFYRASHPLGPFTDLGPRYAPGTIRSQQTDVVAYATSSGRVAYLWEGDHWQSAPDHVKGHDLSTWAPFSIDAAGNVANFTFQSQFVIDIEPQK